MLKLLVLLCWTAIFVSAGDQKNANVPTSLAGDNVAVTLQLPTSTNLPPSPSSKDALPVQTETSKPLDLHPDTSNVPTTNVTNLSEVTHSPEKPKPVTTITTKPTTTTPSTTTSTTAVPTTQAPVTPLPPPKVGKWKVQGENNTLCIIVQMAVQFNVTFVDANNKTLHKEMDIPSNSNATGKCNATEQILTVSWDAPNATKDNLTLHFMKNETSKRYSLHHFEINLASQEFSPNTNETVILKHTVPQYEIALSNSYRCLKMQQLNLSVAGRNETVGHLMISDLQFQAFRSDNTTNFGIAKDCAFDTPDIVPITVGCALAGLVVIVLIAYLVGRRRSQARGYLSM